MQNTPFDPCCNRRQFLKTSTGALLAGLGLQESLALAARIDGGHPLAPRPAHFQPKAKRMIFLYLTGGFSHLDTFDYKPQLDKDANKKVDAPNGVRYLRPSPFKWKRYGQSGMLVSELFSNLGKRVDDVAFIHSMLTDHNNHFEGTLMMHTGSFTIPMPSLGAWLSYGLGTQNLNLPSFVVFAADEPYAGSQVWDANFLPDEHQGVRVDPKSASPIPHLSPPVESLRLRELEQKMLQRFNEEHARLRADDPELQARITSFETARGLMQTAPEAFDLSQETKATLELYGVKANDTNSFAWQCLMARRLSERGVRVIELIDTGSSGNWDSHGNMQGHTGRANKVDRPIAALIGDLKQRGLLDETLIVCCTEFGRTPGGRNANHPGRDHHRWAFTCWLAGGGVKGGVRYGESDEHGTHVAADPVHVHDFHATILHLMGFDHTRLTYRYAGRDFRLTDVHGDVVQGVLA